MSEEFYIKKHELKTAIDQIDIHINYTRMMMQVYNEQAMFGRKLPANEMTDGSEKLLTKCAYLKDLLIVIKSAFRNPTELKLLMNKSVLASCERELIGSYILICDIIEIMTSQLSWFQYLFREPEYMSVLKSHRDSIYNNVLIVQNIKVSE
jgi:hypothetical protein